MHIFYVMVILCLHTEAAVNLGENDNPSHTKKPQASWLTMWKLLSMFGSKLFDCFFIGNVFVIILEDKSKMRDKYF